VPADLQPASGADPGDRQAFEKVTAATNRGVSTTKKTSDSTKKIAKKAAPEKYSAGASDTTVRVKRGDTLDKIAKRHHVKAVWKLNRRRSRIQI
jgi:nucleoid-associated protein YgaU